MPTPIPSEPEKALKRVLRISHFNGWSVVIVAGLGGLLALVLGDWLSVGLGGLVGWFGWLEVKGSRMLRQRDPEGMKWLICSQLLLLGLILVYCASRLGSFDAETVMGNVTPEMSLMLRDAGLEKSDILALVHQMFLAIYISVALASILYQGGLALYYRSKMPPVTEALTLPPEPPSQSVF